MAGKINWRLSAFAVVVAAAAIHSCGKDSRSDNTGSDAAPVELSAADRAAVEVQAVKVARGDVSSLVDASAIERITPDDYPKLYKKLGRKGAEQARQGATVAAWRAIQAKGCQEVQTASITMESSAKNMQFFVNCLSPDMPGGAAQWRFTAAELKDARGNWYTADNAPAAGISDTVKEVNKQENERNQAPANYRQCEAEIRSKLDYPSAAEFHNIAGRADFVNPQNENVIQIEFEAKNGYGAMLPFVANCIFHHNGTLTTDIYKR